MISALEHYSYCPRQCALIHIEQTFDENIYTLRGRQAHERVDVVASRVEDAILVERALPLWSRRLGLVGRADVVEFHGGVPYPVEYKLGKRRDWRYEAIQVCAQGICLEEMYGVPVPGGAIYYIGSRARREVNFDATLRAAVAEGAAMVRTLMRQTWLPEAPNDQRCERCSLLDSCLPSVVVRPGRLRTYRAQIYRIDEGNGGDRGEEEGA
ncbi:MAG: CRISPR-associated protein Cas4 [Ktedonobacterales bacterium]|nr:CRISPR-associated protein Cas4 [Ktedonobacterales bacterium]